ncbi:MFS general substrate transporter [Sistotremastrum niveocremeum HHB9708]|uniref:Autophagy-related protein n=1 Tax=Sistotremastrum niveocremeum HHB9708 TaxID=1314777 RepID=A0A164PWW0_9AGAM|nr:MFS general substrate transporter [Sistotremastrum niveocremeum HHB9708]
MAQPPLVTEDRAFRRTDAPVTELVSSDERGWNITNIDAEGPVVTRQELWSYYLYYNGDNGVGPLGYSLTLFQSLATAAGKDPVTGLGCTDPNSSGQCVLPWAGKQRSVSSVVLIANGLSFMFMTLIFTTIGSAADYGNFGRWLLLVLTLICWGAQFGSIGLVGPDKWGSAMVIYMLGFITYGATLVFYSALFPRLARNTPHSRALRLKLEDGKITPEEYEREESLEKNRISNISTMHSNIGYLFTLAINLSVLLPLAKNPRVDNYTILLTNAYWTITGIWWFIYQQPRPGPKLPPGENYLTIGWKQIWRACRQYKELPYTFVYLFAFFLLADGLNTTGTLVSIVQNDKFSFSFLQNTYLGLAQAATSILSTAGFWYIQRYWKIKTKTMFVVTNIFTVLIPLWGMIGIWTNKIGFHNRWEFWAYNVVFGLFQAPYYAFSQTMMAELAPPGFDNMFFGLFGLSNRASSIIGPNVIQAIINDTGNNWDGFPFLFGLCLAASLVIFFWVDVPKGRRDAIAFAERRRGMTGNPRLDFTGVESGDSTDKTL